MKQILIVLCVGAVVIACGNATSGSSSSEVTVASSAPITDNANEGAKLYKLHCITCHGLYGDMGASGAYNLQTSQLTLEERIEVITIGRNTMIGFKNLLSPEKIKLVAEYTFELKPN